MLTFSFCGAVLVGGRSTRMGRTKARLRVDGQPLWRRQRRLLFAVGARPVFVVLRPRQRSVGAGAAEIRDRARDAGPLAGVAAALHAAPADFVLILAVDLPGLEAKWFGPLLAHCRPACGAVFRGPRGYEPLAAVYPVAAAGPADDRLSQGWHRLQDFVADLVRRRRLTSVPLPAELAPMAANWNRPDDWAPGVRPPRGPVRKSPRR